MLTYGVLTPAYGRDYKSAKDAVADFNAGKDFVVNSVSFSGYASKSDFAVGSHLTLRYGKNRKVTAVTVK